MKIVNKKELKSKDAFSMSVATIPASLEKPVGVQDAIDFIGVSHSKLYDLMSKGIIPYHQIDGQRLFYLTEIDQAIRAL